MANGSLNVANGTFFLTDCFLTKLSKLVSLSGFIITLAPKLAEGVFFSKCLFCQDELN